MIRLMMTLPASTHTHALSHYDTYTFLGEHVSYWLFQSLVNENKIKAMEKQQEEESRTRDEEKCLKCSHKFKEQIMNCLTGETEIETGRDKFQMQEGVCVCAVCRQISGDT